MTKEKLTSLENIKRAYPNLKTIFIVGNGGTGKSTITSKVADSIHATAYFFDDNMFWLYPNHPEIIRDIVPAGDYPDFNNPKSILPFHLANTCKDKKIFSNFLDVVNDKGEKRLCNDIMKRKSENTNENVAQDTSWLNAGFVREPAVKEKNNTFIIDSFTPGHKALKQANKIYKISPSNKEIATLFVAKRQGLVSKKLEEFLLKGASLADARKRGFISKELENFWGIIDMANEVVDETLQEDLSGLEYTQLVNHHKEQSELEGLANRIIKEYYRDIY